MTCSATITLVPALSFVNSWPLSVGRPATMRDMERPAPAASASTPVVHQQLWEVVAERLREEVLSGLLPEGMKLVEADLAARFGVSRGPVREALRELARQGLAFDLPRRGTFVASTTESDMHDVLVAREAIEVAAARLAIEKSRDSELLALRGVLDQMEAAYVSGSRAEAQASDIEVHRAIVALAGNGRLMNYFEELASQTLFLVRAQQARWPDIDLLPPVRLHRDFVDALIARDRERFEEALAEHFAYTDDHLPHLEPRDTTG
jgi:DNA-binding GntR family transcriptional regulator